MLSARGKPDATGYAAPVVPDELPPEGPAYDAMIEALKSNDIVKGKFVSEDGELALIVIALDRAAVEEQSARTIIGGIQSVVDKELEGSGMTATLTGAPVMQLEIRNAVERDRLVYNGLGFLAGLVVAYLFFRRLSLTLIAVAGPSIAILWTLGVVGGLDYRLNLFVNVITPLILVAGFSDSMHLVFSIRRDILAGVDRMQAARNAVLDVAPACLLTAMNAAIAILSFQFAESALIRTFGQAALLAVAISYIAVAVVVPTLAVLLIRPEKETVPDIREHDTGGVGVLQRMSERIIGTVIASPLVYFLMGVGAVAATGWAYAQLTPMYRLADQVPDKEQALAATAKLDEKLTGANPVHVMIQWKKAPDGSGIGLYDVGTLSVIARAHEVLEKEAGLGNVWSLESLRRWLAEAGSADVATIKSYVDILPKHLVRRFIDESETAVLVTARLPDIDASEILPIVDKIDKALTPVRAEHKGYEIIVTGLPAIAARNSSKLISELNWGLIGDIFVIFIFLGIALRSVMAGVSSILPSLFPIFATGALLWAMGQGMQFASIVALTVAFSLAIDSTIHFLNRFRLEEERHRTRPQFGASGTEGDRAPYRSGGGAHDHRPGAGSRRHHAVASAVAAPIRAAGGDLPHGFADRAADHPAGDHRAVQELLPAAALDDGARRHLTRLALFSLLIERKHCGQVGFDRRHARRAGGMGRKPFHGRALLGRGHLLPQRHARARIVPGPRGQFQPDQIGVRFIVARKLERQKPRSRFDERSRRSSDGRRERFAADFGQRTLGDLFAAMFAQRMGHLVSHDDGNLVVRQLQLFENARIEGDLTAGHAKRVDLRGADEVDTPLPLTGPRIEPRSPRNNTIGDGPQPDQLRIGLGRQRAVGLRLLNESPVLLSGGCLEFLGRYDFA